MKLFATHDPEDAGDRSRALQPYAVNGLDAQLAWNGEGTPSVLDMVTSRDIQATGDNEGLVRGTVQVQDGSWRCAAVPVFVVERGGATAFGLSSAPAYVPCAGLTTPARDDLAKASNDSDLVATSKDGLLPPFLAAWAQSDSGNLNRYLLPGGVVRTGRRLHRGPGRRAPPGRQRLRPVGAKGQDADRRTVTFTITLLSTDGEAAQTSTYQVPVVRKGGQWYFASDPTPTTGTAGGDQLPDVQPSQGTGGM